jgi:hypothetical protein
MDSACPAAHSHSLSQISREEYWLLLLLLEAAPPPASAADSARPAGRWINGDLRATDTDTDSESDSAVGSSHSLHGAQHGSYRARYDELMSGAVRITMPPWPELSGTAWPSPDLCTKAWLSPVESGLGPELSERASSKSSTEPL